MYCYYIVNKAHNILDGNSLGGCSGRGNEYGKKSYQNDKNDDRFKGNNIDSYGDRGLHFLGL